MLAGQNGEVDDQPLERYCTTVTVHCTLYILYFTFYILHCTLYIVLQ